MLTQKLVLVLLIVMTTISSGRSTNHWRVNQNGSIIQSQIDSPYFMRRPYDLLTFIKQQQNVDLFNTLFTEMIRLKIKLFDKMMEIESMLDNFFEQTNCILEFYIVETDLFNTIVSPKYLKRLDGGERSASEHNELREMLKCSEVLPLKYSMFYFGHLESIAASSTLKMDAEESLKMLSIDLSASNITRRLFDSPDSWEVHTISSFYWRLHGNAHEAIECAKRAVHLAPREYRDIPLLSLGTILQRSRQSADAAVLFTAAVDHAPHIAENQFSLANGLIMLSEFNRSLQCYAAATQLDSSFVEQANFVKNTMLCFKQVKTTLDAIDSVVSHMKQLIKTFEGHKRRLEKCNEALILSQVPLSMRFTKYEFGSDKQPAHNLLTQRSQSCSTRSIGDQTEPILFCDFHSDTQMRLKSSEITIDDANKYANLLNEVIMDDMSASLGVYKNLDVNNIDDKMFKQY